MTSTIGTAASIQPAIQRAPETYKRVPLGSIENLLNPMPHQSGIPEVTSHAIVIHKRGSAGLELSSIQRALNDVGSSSKGGEEILPHRLLSSDDFIQSLESLVPSDSFTLMRLAAYNRNFSGINPYTHEIDFLNSRDLDEVLLDPRYQHDWKEKAIELLDVMSHHPHYLIGKTSPYVATIGGILPEHKPELARFIKSITDKIQAAHDIADLKQRIASYDKILKCLMNLPFNLKTLKIIAFEKLHLMKGYTSEEKTARMNYIYGKGSAETPKVKKSSSESPKSNKRFKAVEKSDRLLAKSDKHKLSYILG